MARGFVYDLLQLIECVKERPCLWDKSLEVYKDRVERRNAWEEIFRSLDGGYDDMSWEDKKITGELVLNKWTNIRDTFVKTLKMKTGKPKRKYLYHEQLKFLIKVMPEEECCYEFLPDEPPMKLEDLEGTSHSHSTRKKKKVVDNDDYVPKKMKKEKEVKQRLVSQSHDSDYEVFDNRTDNIDFVEVESDQRLMNEDEAFFASLLPTVVRYNEDERLEFRMEVLALMKRLKDKRSCDD